MRMNCFSRNTRTGPEKRKFCSLFKHLKNLLDGVADLHRERSFVFPYSKTLGLVTITGVGLFGVRKWMAGGVCHSKALLDGKTVLITGGNKETAVDLARRGAKVILACRDMDKTSKAAEEVRKRCSNANVIVKKLDLASLQSVRQLAKDILASEERLDVLISNAGTGVMTYSLHPGVIRTELGRHLQLTMPLWMRAVCTTLIFFVKSPTQGARTTIYCAVEESLQKESGLYYMSMVVNP